MKMPPIVYSALAVTRTEESKVIHWAGDNAQRISLIDLWARRVLGGSANKATLDALMDGTGTVEPFRGQLATVKRALSSSGGPGTELKRILNSLGFLPDNCLCNTRMLTMDAWGADGCRKNYKGIVGWLREEQANRGWLAKAKAGVLALASGIAMKVNPLDPAPGLLDEAIRRWEQIVAHNHD